MSHASACACYRDGVGAGCSSSTHTDPHRRRSGAGRRYRVGAEGHRYPGRHAAGDRLIAELKPLEIAVVIVEFPELPLVTEADEGDALIVKLGFDPVTVSDTVVV